RVLFRSRAFGLSRLQAAVPHAAPAYRQRRRAGVRPLRQDGGLTAERGGESVATEGEVRERSRSGADGTVRIQERHAGAAAGKDRSGERRGRSRAKSEGAGV